MQGTFTTPLGKIRVASMRRFVLLRSHDYRGPYIVKRSDMRATLVKLARSGDVILDTVEGTVC